MAPMIDGAGSAASLRFAVIRSRFNEAVTKHLLEGALEALRGAGAKNDAIDVISVPGAFEIPLIAAQLAKSQRYDAVVCLGAVIRGETAHFEYISMAVSQGIARVAYDYEVPVIFGVLTTDTEEQAEARATPSHKGRAHTSRRRKSNKSRAWIAADDRCNKGYEAGKAAIEMANLMKRLNSIRTELDIVRGEIDIVRGEPVEPPPRQDRSPRFPKPRRQRKRP
jgi:6,7-dimethyl-8-ribityllumazine synthase